jgi:hypothetical protein
MAMRVEMTAMKRRREFHPADPGISAWIPLALLVVLYLNDGLGQPRRAATQRMSRRR